MMEFSDNKPIYKQIVDYAFNSIIDGTWHAEARVPSVRELAADMGVNTRTVLKAMEDLQDMAVIIPKRGMGFLLAPDARELVKEARRKEFFQTTLPAMVAEMKRLEIKPQEIIDKLQYGK